jgi:hypothetical protein
VIWYALLVVGYALGFGLTLLLLCRCRETKGLAESEGVVMVSALVWPVFFLFRFGKLIIRGTCR